MLRKMRVLLLVCITAVLAACGGGDETPSFAGTYLISSASVTSNTCGSSVAAVSGGTVGVTQNGRNVTWVEAGGTYPGTVDADNGGFTVTAAQSGAVVTVSMRSAGGNAYALKMTATGTACSIVWSGTATKTS